MGEAPVSTEMGRFQPFTIFLELLSCNNHEYSQMTPESIQIDAGKGTESPVSSVELIFETLKGSYTSLNTALCVQQTRCNTIN